MEQKSISSKTDMWTDSDDVSIRRARKDVTMSHTEQGPEEIPLMINALKGLYKNKLRPFELKYRFDKFSSPCLTDAYFDAKPFVLLIGQYSVGKTTFIRYLLERDFPGVRIGPEPTTDRFMVLMSGPIDRTIPGNALCADGNKPFTALTKFGMGFMNKFECAECQSPILEKISMIDTPGILSGEKQRIGRQYSFPDMCEWFAELSDRILLLFDAHKLDISDEFKDTIQRIRSQDDKVRIVLNKADIPTQLLLRVYGALMWSLGKVFNTPEVLRVYVGSFWDQPLKNKENQKLMDMEEKDLLADLRSLPRNVAVRKINEIIKRARRAQVHCYIISHLREQFGMFGKQSKQQELLKHMPREFTKVMQKHQVAKTDFPNVNAFRNTLQHFQIAKFPKMPKNLQLGLDHLLSTDMPKLMEMVPAEIGGPSDSNELNKPANPFDITEYTAHKTPWAIDGPTKKSFDVEFNKLPQTGGKVLGQDMKKELMNTGLSPEFLHQIWELGDIDQDGKLDSDEYAVCMFLVDLVQNKVIEDLPAQLPKRLIPPSKRYLFEMS